MKWCAVQPKFGDVIRIEVVKNKMYHVGVYVSDSEVIQFGNIPDLDNPVPDEKVEVCVCDYNYFSTQRNVEVMICEDGDFPRFSPEETVSNARSKIGEKGYSFLFNNCEHFAFLCAFGKKFSPQVENMKKICFL